MLRESRNESQRFSKIMSKCPDEQDKKSMKVIGVGIKTILVISFAYMLSVINISKRQLFLTRYKKSDWDLIDKYNVCKISRISL